MLQISDNTLAVQPSKIRRMFNKALSYDSVLSFAIGEPDFTASSEVAEKGREAIALGLTKYSENAGILQLRQSLSKYLQKEIGVRYEAATEIIVTPGAMGALYLAFKVLLNPGDEVIVFEPCWTNYQQQIQMCGGVPVAVPCKEAKGFDLDVERLARELTPRTKAVVINSPCNPTGAVVSYAALEQLAELAAQRDLAIISDEVYKHILYDGRTYRSIASFRGMKERTVVIDSMSKTHAMTGWRVGCAAGPEEVIANMVKLQENVAACAAMPSQYAAVEALEGSQNHVQEMVRAYTQRRDYIMKRIQTLPGISGSAPGGTFYAFLSVEGTGMDSETFADLLLEQEQVVVVPATAFGGGEFGSRYIRLSFAASMETIREGLDRMETFIRRNCAAPIETEVVKQKRDKQCDKYEK